MSKEVENYMYLYEKIENEDYQKRVKNSFEYYINSATFYKRLGMILSILGIVLPALAAIFTACDVNKGLIVFATSAATVASGIFASLKCSDKQEAYRKAAENMKSELAAYVAEQGDYKKADDKNAILFERIESIIQNGYDRIVELDKESERSASTFKK